MLILGVSLAKYPNWTNAPSFLLYKGRFKNFYKKEWKQSDRVSRTHELQISPGCASSQPFLISANSWDPPDNATTFSPPLLHHCFLTALNLQPKPAFSFITVLSCSDRSVGHAVDWAGSSWFLKLIQSIKTYFSIMLYNSTHVALVVLKLQYQ